MKTAVVASMSLSLIQSKYCIKYLFIAFLFNYCISPKPYPSNFFPIKEIKSLNRKEVRSIKKSCDTLGFYTNNIFLIPYKNKINSDFTGLFIILLNKKSGSYDPYTIPVLISKNHTFINYITDNKKNEAELNTFLNDITISYSLKEQDEIKTIYMRGNQPSALIPSYYRN